MSIKIIGTCSICGGIVSVPEVWLGIYPPVPTCQSCGAVIKNYYPVIPMEPRPKPNPYFPKRKRNTFPNNDYQNYQHITEWNITCSHWLL